MRWFHRLYGMWLQSTMLFRQERVQQIGGAPPAIGDVFRGSNGPHRYAYGIVVAVTNTYHGCDASGYELWEVHYR
jgi:aspartyl/asparaginyl beta-hydroxylase (cupin superfamily)